MGIDDIMAEKNGGRPRQQQPAQNQQSQSSTSSGTLTVEVPDPMSGDREAMLFWLNVVQTVLLLGLFLRN